MGGLRRTRASGFTLIEALVSLALFSLISLLIWHAMVWIARVDERLGDAWRFSTQDALRAEWVRAAIRGAVSGGVGDPNNYRGTPLQIEMYSVAPPWVDKVSPLWMRLTIVSAVEGDAVELVASADGVESIILWRGEPSSRAQVAFEFLDHKNAWHLHWPPQPGVGKDSGFSPLVQPEGVLPAAVKISNMPKGTWLVTLDAQAHTLPTRKSLLGQ